MSEPSVLQLREQFSTPEQQRETSTAGMWIFLMSEVLLFGALFTAFTMYRISHPHAFDLGSKDMEIVLGSVNTAVLICSSYTMALAVHSAETGRQNRLMLFLLLTMIIGAIFIGIKFTEYYLHYQDHKAPGFWFEEHAPGAANIQMFFVFYFIMTGLHALHMLIGIGILAILFLRALAGRFSAEYHSPIDFGGLYWHFIDIVWVFLYAIFYIPGLHVK